MKKRIGDLKLDDFTEGCVIYGSLPKPVNPMTCEFCQLRKICLALISINLEDEIEVEIDEEEN